MCRGRGYTIAMLVFPAMLTGAAWLLNRLLREKR